MLALAPLRNCNDGRKGGEGMESFSIGDDDFSAGNLLDDIDFDDLFVGMDYGDVLPDLEIDPEMLAEFSVSGGEESEFNNVSTSNENVQDQNGRSKEDEDRGSGSGSVSCLSREDEIVSKRDDSNKVNNNPSNKESSRSRKSGSNQTKGSQGKRKVKVDWTPELHRRFVQAVEQLGMDKAVPSRILEIMGIDCLTRHNIASHLQKYRSHQKHLLAREAEAASWSQRRQIYGGGGSATARGSSKMGRSDHHHQVNPWMMNAPTMGFPPPAAAAAAPPPNMIHPYRPLHVWGHPTVDHSMHMWPKHLHHSPSPPPPPHPHRWPPMPSSPSDPSSYWHPNHHQRVPNGLTPAGTPCFPHHQQLAAATRSAPPVVPGIPPPPPHAMYKVDHGIGGVVPPPSVGHSDSHPPPFDLLHPTKERIDAAIGDVLSKPWLPLPLGLKPPALDSVLVELQRQGIPKIPPGTTTTTPTTTTSASTTPSAAA